MLGALATIFKENWQWRRQIGQLALFDLKKKTRGTALSWAWLLIKPAIFVFVFWFALEVGLRIGENASPPYFLWLIAGLIPWFYMQDMLAGGSAVFTRYSYLVNKIKFPMSGIPTMANISCSLVGMILIAILFIIYFAYGMPLDIYLLQIPLILVMMFAFFNMYSLLTSLLTALSKDFAQLIKALITPLFWLSGIIFDIQAIKISWIQSVMFLNPITFFATAFRDAFYHKTWFWDNPTMLGGFGFVFLVTLVVMLALYKRLHEEVPDAL